MNQKFQYNDTVIFDHNGETFEGIVLLHYLREKTNQWEYSIRALRNCTKNENCNFLYYTSGNNLQ